LIRTTASLLFVALGAAASFAAPVEPSAPRARLPEYEASARVIGRSGPFEPLADLTERWQFAGQRPYRAMTLGSYGRVHRNLKLYLVQTGARHDDDWTTDNAGSWFWRPTTNRPENIVILDATPRASLGGHFTGALKVRYEHNFFNGQRTLKLEPEVAWFWLDGLAPKATIFLRHGTYIPLNFGTRSYYERWWYLAGLWHPSPSLSLGPSVALRDTVWSTSSAYRDLTGGVSYRVLYRAVVYGFTLVLRSR
jgi:hypothetical protein